MRTQHLYLFNTMAQPNSHSHLLLVCVLQAPEMYEESYNERVDIYAFGMCVLEMVGRLSLIVKPLWLSDP